MNENTDPSAADTVATPAGRVIKKYPNRRLYDTQTSAYITLAEVKSLVLSAQPFSVKDAKTGEDLTRSILLQIILEEETAGVPLFTEAMLGNIIRFYGHSMQHFMGSFLERNFQVFMDMQSKLTDQSKSAAPEMWGTLMQVQNPLMDNYIKNSQNAMVQMQEQMLGAFGLKR